MTDLEAPPSMRLRTLTKTSPLSADLGLLIVRLWFGALLAFGHGYGKILDLEAFIGSVSKRGLPLPGLLGPAAALSEFLGGILFALGLFTRPAATLILVTMLVAALHVHAADPFSKQEFALAYGMAALAILVAGPGRFSVDARFWRKR